MSASGLLNKVKSVEAICGSTRSNLSFPIWLSIRAAGVANWTLMVIGCFFLCGCSTTFMQDVKSVATEMTTSAPEVGPYDARPPAYPTPTYPTPTVNPQVQNPQPTAAATQPASASVAPSPAWPAPAASPQQTHVTESRPTVATPAVAAPAPAPTPAPVGKGAAQLMIPNDPPVMRVNARAAVPVEPEKRPAAGTLAAADPGPMLILKGPPREEKSYGSATKWVIIFVLLFAGATIAGVAWFKMRRKVVIAEAQPKKEKPPAGWEMKEPAGHGPDTVLEA